MTNLSLAYSSCSPFVFRSTQFCFVTISHFLLCTLVCESLRVSRSCLMNTVHYAGLSEERILLVQNGRPKERRLLLQNSISQPMS